VILIEQPGGKVKVSWRAKPGVNVSRLAESFGGGGHEAAAGAMIVGDLEGVTDSVLAATFDVVKADVEK
jgi:phosphoesterase RecJ-like protein